MLEVLLPSPRILDSSDLSWLPGIHRVLLVVSMQMVRYLSFIFLTDILTLNVVLIFGGIFVCPFSK